MKQRFSYLDLRLVVNELASELGECRLQNVYSLEASPRHFMFKFDARDGAGKRYVIVDPGLRLHMTRFQHEPTPQPSQFVVKLRKHLRTRRASRFWIAPGSRLLVVAFSEGRYFLVFEFFAGGNILLLDSNHRIMTLFRIVRGPTTNCTVGETYPLPEDVLATKVASTDSAPISLDQVTEWLKTNEKLGKVLYQKVFEPSTSMIDVCLRRHGVDPRQSNGEPQAIKSALDDALEWAHDLMSKPTVPGWVLRDHDKSLEFEPFAEYFEQVLTLEAGDRELHIERYSTYNETVDAYFGSLLEDRQTSRIDQLHAVAAARLEAARSERENRVRSLLEVQKHNERCGRALQLNHSLADAAITAVRAIVDQGTDWGDAEQLLKLEQERGNTVAQIITKMDIGSQKITLKLQDEENDDDDAANYVHVVVRIDESAFANARNYFDVRRAASTKQERTEQHANEALRSAERKIQRDLAVNLAKSTAQTRQLHAIREPYWFEKFYWFLCSDVAQTLVIAGHDELQNELLLRRYFARGDVLVHSDAPGAAVVLIKNPKGTGEPTPQALAQAAAFCSATSPRTWDAGRGGLTWYVTRDQVPRLTESGDPITVGDISRLSRRTTLPPTPLDMGLAILWKMPESGDAGDSSSSEAGNDLQSDSEDEFPDTQFDSDDDFPDTVMDSDPEPPATGSSYDSSQSDMEHSVEPSSEHVSAPLKPTTYPETAHTTDEPVKAIEQLAEEDQSANGVDGDATVTKSHNHFHGDQSVDGLANASEDEQPGPENSQQQTSQQWKPKKFRGAAKKQRKLKKYLEQDEEDRVAAMKRLGTLKGLQRQRQEQQERDDKRLQQQEQQRLRKQRAREAELARISAEATEPTPYPKDLSLTWSENAVAAVPVFGPWPALRQVQHKVKLTPGSVKKSKAVTEVLRVILGPEPPQKQIDHLAALKLNHVQGIVPVSKVQLGLGARASKNGNPGKSSGKATGGKQNKGKPSKKGKKN